MKIRYLIFSIISISIIMFALYGSIVRFTEVSSFFWSLHRHKNLNKNASILVFGDSQLISGLEVQTISKKEVRSLKDVLFLARPSEQPEGMLDQFLTLHDKLPNLKKVYLNVSPISVSQNSVTDAHKQLYYGFGEFHIHQLTNKLLRKAYFGSLTDLVWKLVIEVFPFFGLNQNSSAMLALVPSNTQFYETEEINADSFRPNSLRKVLSKRYEENHYLKNHLEANENWTWKAYRAEKTLNENSVYPEGSALGFMKERKLSLDTLIFLIQEIHKVNAKVVCLDIPFSLPLEEDMEKHQIRKTLSSAIGSFGCDEYIKIDREILKKREYFTDFTHLNAKGRDVLSNYLLNKKD